MNETEKAFREDLEILLNKYNATIGIANYGDGIGCEIEVDCNPREDCVPCANFTL